MTRGGEREGAGRPRTIEDGAGGATRKTLWLGSDLLRRLAKWARAQPDKPAQSEAVRRLLDAALKAKGY